MNELQRASVEHAVKVLREQAEPVGPMHSHWDTIFELEAMLNSDRAEHGPGYDNGRASMRQEIRDAWKIHMAIKPTESQTEYDLRRAFYAARLIKMVIE